MENDEYPKDWIDKLRYATAVREAELNEEYFEDKLREENITELLWKMIMNNKPHFTKEQEYWICYVIGGWYLEWKDKIIRYNTSETIYTGQHNLGQAMVQLKSLLCSHDEEDSDGE